MSLKRYVICWKEEIGAGDEKDFLAQGQYGPLEVKKQRG